MSRTRTFLAGLALSVLPAVAFAAPTTPADLTAMRKLLGYDLVPTAIADQMMSSPGAPVPRDANQRTCIRGVLVAAYAAKTDTAFKKVFASHEDVVAWQRFAATNGGRMLLGHLREQTLAMVNGRQPASMDALDARLDAAGRAEIEAFVATPVGAKGPPRMEQMSDAEAGAMMGLMRQRCGVGEAK